LKIAKSTLFVFTLRFLVADTFVKVKAQKDDATESLNQAIASRDATIRSLNTSISQRDATIQKLNARIAEQDQTIQSLQKPPKPE